MQNGSDDELAHRLLLLRSHPNQEHDVKTIDILDPDALSTITGGISWPTIPNPLPSPLPLPRPFPNPSPLPSPFPNPFPNPFPRIGAEVGRMAGEALNHLRSK